RLDLDQLAEQTDHALAVAQGGQRIRAGLLGGRRVQGDLDGVLFTPASRTRIVLGFACARSDTLASLGPFGPTRWLFFAEIDDLDRTAVEIRRAPAERTSLALAVSLVGWLGSDVGDRQEGGAALLELLEQLDAAGPGDRRIDDHALQTIAEHGRD